MSIIPWYDRYDRDWLLHPKEYIHERAWLDQPVSQVNNDLKYKTFEDISRRNTEVPDIHVNPKFYHNKFKNTMWCDIIIGSLHPEDVELNVTGREIEFVAKTRVHTDGGSYYTYPAVRHVFPLPHQVDAYRMTATLRPGGRLIIEIPTTSPYEGNYSTYRRPIPIVFRRDPRP